MHLTTSRFLVSLSFTLALSSSTNTFNTVDAISIPFLNGNGINGIDAKGINSFIDTVQSGLGLSKSSDSAPQKRSAGCTTEGRNPFTDSGFVECCPGLEKELGHDSLNDSFHYICIRTNLNSQMLGALDNNNNNNINIAAMNQPVAQNNNNNVAAMNQPVAQNNNNNNNNNIRQQDDDFNEAEADRLEDSLWDVWDSYEDDDDELGPEPGDEDYY